MPHSFRANATHTLGVELELQLVDAETMALSPGIEGLLQRVPRQWVEKIKPEFMQSYCEINTDVCATVGEVRMDLEEKLAWADGAARELGLRLAWGGTHPFSRWDEQLVSSGKRYAWLLEVMQDIARRMVVFGLHVHVGVDSGDKAIQTCDRLLRHLPTMLALSANSPLWCGRRTGLASYRSKILEALPTAGLPPLMRNWSEYTWLINHLITTGFIQTRREIWWDVRPHAAFGTVEIRVMDMPLNLPHTLGLVALAQCVVAGISEQIDRGAYLYDCHPIIATQNRWHAGRFGLDAHFVDPDTMKAVPARLMARRLIELCLPHAQRLGCLDALHGLYDIIDHGTGAQRQLDLLDRGGDLRDVVRLMTGPGTAQPSAPTVESGINPAWRDAPMNVTVPSQPAYPGPQA